MKSIPVCAGPNYFVVRIVIAIGFSHRANGEKENNIILAAQSTAFFMPCKKPQNKLGICYALFLRIKKNRVIRAMKIVITDGYTLNPGDLSWDRLSGAGEIIYYDRSSPAQVAGRCREASAIITNKTPITAEVIAAATQLKVIAVSATGYNIVDTVAARMKNIPVCNVPVYGTDSVAQHAFALLLELSNHVGKHNYSVQEGEWSNAADWSYTKAPIV